MDVKLFRIFIVSFSSILLSQNLVFFNDEESIIFKENELITINGEEYRYEKALKNKTQILLLKSGFLTRKNMILDTDKIETFRTHKVRYSTRNAFKKAFKGFKVGFGVGGLLGFASPFGTDRGSIVEKTTGGLFLGSVLGIVVGSSYGAPIGFIYGLVARGESELHISYYYNIKFDDNINSNVNNQE